jgi:hypothetical protein
MAYQIRLCVYYSDNYFGILKLRLALFNYRAYIYGMSKIKQGPGRPSLPKSLSANNRVIRVTDADWELFNKAATEKGLTVSAWLRDIATRAARKIVGK